MKNGEDPHARGFKPSKTWMSNPQLRVFLDPDDKLGVVEKDRPMLKTPSKVRVVTVTQGGRGLRGIRRTRWVWRGGTSGCGRHCPGCVL